MEKLTYNSVSDEIEHLGISLKVKLLSIAVGLLCSLVLVSGPVAVCINMLIFNNYVRLFAFLIALLIIFVIFFSDYMYLHLITKGRVEGLYHVWSIDTLVMSLVVLLAYFILTVIGVI